jgi:hypothetical protein
MLKKTLFCLFGFALLLGSGNALFAQDSPFTAAPPAGGVVQLHEDTKLNLRNSAELTAEELRAALETSSCSTARGAESATACAACTGLNCTGNCYAVPCTFYANAKDQVPPQPGFRSFVTGCTTTYVSTCNDLSADPAQGCQLFAFQSATWGNNTCVNSNTLVLQSFGCV